MRLTVVGCSGSMSGPDSAASCYLVQADAPDEDGTTRTWSIVLDLGSGAFGALLRHLDPARLDAVVLSHLHADHVVDMTGLEVYRRYHPAGALGPVRVLGPAGTPERIGALTMEEDLSALDASFTFAAHTPGRAVTVGPLRIESAPVDHPVPAYGVRVTGPSEDGEREVVLAYSGDTDECAGVVDVARDADLFLCEAAFQEGRDSVRGIHLTGRRAGEAATRAAVRQLVLTHLQPWTDAEVVRAEAAATYGGPIELARPDAVWQL
ncbi:Ribonuclease BN, tRNA processing enzyme [Georgenia satyanarayanai]|uniref:Ribonuclease BN, tRNA processing enzyme n=1 Tax=Georgenia satyanarayanai TaxID=860221 RepID=A0A2Y9A6Z9_9MICO|nr:MBL fold metallo-hydrolase [Georgenia satyanarayanai]PYG00097.1 ribonuclease BN (tRNA processing enzyme) [Georgenia satyanarayanai]SSA40120.1 Ribonuclease BN, tRNA processing enzyme [Georgenia satyanarayanai]